MILNLNDGKKIQDVRIIRLILKKLNLDSRLVEAKRIYENNNCNLEDSIKSINFVCGGNTSDGYHTFDELYEHRNALFLALSRYSKGWKSLKHHDGTNYDGWFIVGIDIPDNPITYHLPLSLWDKASHLETLEKGKEWDGHTSQDVIQRLYSIL